MTYVHVKGHARGLRAATTRRKTCLDREKDRGDNFYYIEVFYNPKRCHCYENNAPPVGFEKQYFNWLTNV